MMIFIEIIIGFSSGVLIGSIFMALLLILKLLPRILQFFQQTFSIKTISLGLVLGSLFGTYLSFTSSYYLTNHFILISWGLLHGVFNGMLAAALLEILHVFPLLTKRIGLKGYLPYFLYALLLGKVVGALVQALYFYE